MNRRQACRLGAGLGGLGLSVGLGAAVGLGGCAPVWQPPPQSLLISGADTMLPLLRTLALGLSGAQRPLQVIIEAGGALPAYLAASRNAIDLAAMTRPLSDSEDSAAARHYLIGRDHLRLLVHPALPLATLSSEQLRALLTGRIDNWQAVGAPARPVSVYAHRRGSSARRAAEQLLLDGGDFAADAREVDTNDALAAAVAADPGALGYLAGHSLTGQEACASLAVDGVAATPSSVLSGRYPYSQGLYLLLHGEAEGPGAALLDYARSAAGQALVASFGLLAVC